MTRSSSQTRRLQLGLLVCALALGTQPAWPAQPMRADRTAPHLADYDAEPRRPDGRVDVAALAQRLADLGVTKYYWLVWHAKADWEDLKLFLPLAAKAHIETWVYLVPPTEGPPHYPASEPFKLDYARWAEAIAQLSLEQTNLTGWVIDDFYPTKISGHLNRHWN